MENVRIFSTDLPDNDCAVTLHNSSIHINRRYFEEVNFCIQICATVLTIYLHEIAHILVKSFPEKDNFFLLKKEFKFKFIVKGKVSVKKFNEIGDFFEFVLFNSIKNSIKKYYLSDSKYLLNSTNYSVDYEKFKINLISVRESIKPYERKKTGYKAKLVDYIHRRNGHFIGYCGKGRHKK